jgi:hypothetical protein|tara:strand:- start:4355 stop:5353 length:999 start_codon:yes stop_codon:yes gene_type:complete
MDSIINLIALTYDNIWKPIPNQVLRKPELKDFQDTLNPNSICIVSNYKFYESMEWSDKIKAICHPFHKTNMFPPDKDLHFFSESDFCDKAMFRKIAEEKEYDCIIFTFDSKHGLKTKGLYALPICMQAARRLDLKLLVIDYEKVRESKGSHREAQKGSLGERWRVVRRQISQQHRKADGLIKIKRGKIPHEEVGYLLSKSKFVIFPNTRDASPRLISEALCLGVPVVVNEDIYGGWKYVNKSNGILLTMGKNYDDFRRRYDRIERRIGRKIKEMAEREFDSQLIQDQYHSQFGIVNASRKLAEIVNKIEGKELYKCVVFSDLSHLLKDSPEI